MHNPGGGQIMSPPSWHFAAKIMCVSCRRHLLLLDTTRYNAGQTCASGTDNAQSMRAPVGAKTAGTDDARYMRAPVGAKTVPCLHSGTYSDAQICNI